MGYLCDDEHVKEIGIWIDEWGYDKNTRTLRYKLSSILTDKDDIPDTTTVIKSRSWGCDLRLARHR